MVRASTPAQGNSISYASRGEGEVVDNALGLVARLRPGRGTQREHTPQEERGKGGCSYRHARLLAYEIASRE